MSKNGEKLAKEIFSLYDENVRRVSYDLSIY